MLTNNLQCCCGENDRSLFHSYKLLDNPIHVNGFGSELSASAPGKGNLMLRTKVNGAILVINNVLHVPSGRVHLISSSELDKKGIATWISDGKISLLKSNSIIAHDSLWNNLSMAYRNKNKVTYIDLRPQLGNLPTYRSHVSPNLVTLTTAHAFCPRQAVSQTVTSSELILAI